MTTIFLNLRLILLFVADAELITVIILLIAIISVEIMEEKLWKQLLQLSFALLSVAACSLDSSRRFNLKSRFLSTSNARSFRDLSSAIDSHSCIPASILFPFPPVSSIQLAFTMPRKCERGFRAWRARFPTSSSLVTQNRAHTSTDMHSARRCFAQNKFHVEQKSEEENLQKLSWRNRPMLILVRSRYSDFSFRRLTRAEARQVAGSDSL